MSQKTGRAKLSVRNVVLAVTLAAYAAAQCLYVAATPLQTITLPDNLPRSGPQSLLVGIGPDEKEHFLYVLSLARRGEPPAPDPQRRASPQQFVSYQAQHPPLFYALAALVYRAFSGVGEAGVWYVLRGLCALCGAAVIVLSSKTAAVAFPDRPLVVLGTGPFVAFLPMFGHMTGNLSNEPLAMVFGAWAWLQAVRIARAETPFTTGSAARLGLTLGLAALTRLTALLWLPAVLVVLVFAARREPARRLFPLLPWAAGVAAPLTPWLARNVAAFGTPFLRTFHRPLLQNGATVPDFLAGVAPPPAEFPVVITPLFTALWYASTAWLPFWLVQFYLPGGAQAGPAWQAILLLVDAAALLLLFLHASRSRRSPDPDDPAGRALLWAAGSAVAFCGLALAQQQLWGDWNVVLSAGRYLVAAVPASALLFLFALSTVMSSATAQQRAAGVAAGLMLVFDLYAASLVRRFYADNPRQPAVQRVESAASG